MMKRSRMNHWSIAIVLFVFSTDIECLNNGKLVPFGANLKASVKCACKHPQPRLIHIDELEEHRIPNAIFLPQALLIHRCDRSIGYCHAPAYECLSVEREEEDVTFHVKNLFTSLKPQLTSVTLRNHTRCKCVSVRSRITGTSSDMLSAATDIP